MSVGLPDIKLLWGRAGGLCSMCKIKLSEDKQTSNEAFPFGEQAHIVAEEDNGPRGKSLLTKEQRNSYPNLILLCPNHHTMIDKAPEEYPLELLHQIKSEHELWFEKTRTSAADKLKQAQDYIYSEIINAAAKLCMFEEWEVWTSHALSTVPKWQREWIENVETFRQRIIRTVWPGKIPELEEALETLSINLAMAVKTFSKHSESGADGWVNEVRFYRFAQEHDEYERLGKEYDEWLDEQYEFLFEATKCANWVADVVRNSLNPMFFAVPGKFVITTGPNMRLQFVTQVLKYSEEEKKQAHEKVLQKLKADFDEQRKLEKEMRGE
jgi:hypothetical protein